jgi:hypothetical protein
MTDDIKAKALALVNEVLEGKALNNTPFTHLPAAVSSLVLLRAIEQHEAFKQEVSDAVTALLDRFLGDGLSQGVINGHLHRFIISAGVPDALVDVWGDLFIKNYNLDQFCAALEACGLEIRSKNDD